MKTIAVTNQKGGVGKTTTSVNLSAAVALQGFRTLLVDMDPQSNATSGVGGEKADLDNSLYAAIIGEKPLKEIIKPAGIDNLFLAPSGIDLVGTEIELAAVENRERRLKDALDTVKNDFDYVFLDCPPSLGLITLNSLVAADSYLIPIQCEYYALEGLSQLLRTIEFVKERFQSKLEMEGILLTMYDGRSNLTRQVREEVEKHFGQKIFRTWIPRNIRLAEAPSFGKPGVTYDPQAVGARAYKLTALEFLQNNNAKLFHLNDESNPAEQPTPENNTVGVS